MQKSKYSSILLMDSSNFDVNTVKFFDEKGDRQEVKSSVERIKTEGEQEFVVLANKMEIPIERIHSVDGEISPFYSDDFFSCDCV